MVFQFSSVVSKQLVDIVQVLLAAQANFNTLSSTNVIREFNARVERAGFIEAFLEQTTGDRYPGVIAALKAYSNRLTEKKIQAAKVSKQQERKEKELEKIVQGARKRKLAQGLAKFETKAARNSQERDQKLSNEQKAT